MPYPKTTINGKDASQLWRCNTCQLLEEVLTNRSAWPLRWPLNIFKQLLCEVAERAIKLNDPELNVLMLRLNLYEVPAKDLSRVIEQQKKKIKTQKEVNNE